MERVENLSSRVLFFPKSRDRLIAGGMVKRENRRLHVFSGRGQ